jgi:hypothetical protein
VVKIDIRSNCLLSFHGNIQISMNSGSSGSFIEFEIDALLCCTFVKQVVYQIVVVCYTFLVNVSFTICRSQRRISGRKPETSCVESEKYRSYVLLACYSNPRSVYIRGKILDHEIENR